MGSGKQRWKIYFHKSPSTLFLLKKQSPSIPNEFLCPIAGTLMADPVIVSSGHTFERNCVRACVSLSFKPKLADGSSPNFSTIIPNLALKSTIFNWCHTHLIDPPKPIDFYSAEKMVSALIHTSQNPSTKSQVEDVKSELTRTPSQVSITSSEESVTLRNGFPTPLPLKTRPSCCSSSSSSDMETLNPNSLEEEEFLTKMTSYEVSEQKESLISLRKLTRTQEETRLHLCTPRLLSALKSLITSRYSSLQVNAVAVLVNLSLENQNKVKIVRSGIVPPVIDVLRGGFPESQDHAAGALFSLSLDDQNKTAIGVLGALPPLLHALRSDSERTRHDSALALYHLSLVQSNRVKMIKLGAVQILLGMVKSGHMTGRILLVLCNFAASVEGRTAMLDGGGVDCLVSKLSQDEFDSESTRESCVAALYGLSYGGLRFKGLAKEAGAEEVLKKVEESGNKRAREKAGRILEVLRVKDPEEEEIDWEELLSEDNHSVNSQNLARAEF
ncbi:U-box domain-containing protein 40 [Abeliophyllum distichum]|uniref:RING-type E3 ubiquitin transferase n=1 Tax=Abeliophyllum distichum TaxID=126358 RepID=A0ABD1SXC2_9LAMI